MASVYRKGNYAKKLGALEAVGQLKKALENYEKAQKRNPNARDGNYKALDLDFLAAHLGGVVKEVKNDNYYDANPEVLNGR